MNWKLFIMSGLFTVFLASGSPAVTNGLVAYYPFNGNANDESGNSNHGTVSGAVLTTDRMEKALGRLYA